MTQSLADLGHQFALAGGFYCMQCGRHVIELALQPRRCAAAAEIAGAQAAAESTAERDERIWRAIQDVGRGA